MYGVVVRDCGEGLGRLLRVQEGWEVEGAARGFHIVQQGSGHLDQRRQEGHPYQLQEDERARLVTGALVDQVLIALVYEPPSKCGDDRGCFPGCVSAGMIGVLRARDLSCISVQESMGISYGIMV